MEMTPKFKSEGLVRESMCEKLHVLEYENRDP